MHDERSLASCMTEPSQTRVAGANRLAGQVLMLSDSDKMGPEEFAAMLRRADQTVAVERKIVVSSTVGTTM